MFMFITPVLWVGLCLGGITMPPGIYPFDYFVQLWVAFQRHSFRKSNPPRRTFTLVLGVPKGNLPIGVTSLNYGALTPPLFTLPSDCPVRIILADRFFEQTAFIAGDR